MNALSSTPREAIILAGGLGTRLRSLVSDVPKPMALINDRPFLEILLDYWIIQGIKKFILSVGYKKEIIINHFGSNYKGVAIKYAVESDLLGTGGALVNAIKRLEWTDDFILINGDTYFEVDLKKLTEFHKINDSILTFSLIIKNDIDRYKPIFLDKTGRIIELKQSNETPLMVNGGVYIIGNKVTRALLNFNKYKFSFENDFVDNFIKNNQNIYGCSFNNKFVDIGTPLDYKNFKSNILDNF